MSISNGLHLEYFANTPSVLKTLGVSALIEPYMIDQALIDLVKKHNHSAFKEMYDKCIRYVYAIVKRYISNANDHEDILQETFARIFLSIYTFDSTKGEFKPWLRRIAINQCIQHIRKYSKHNVMVTLNNIEEPKEDLEIQLTGLSKLDIEQMLFNMPEGYRQVFMLIAIDDYKHSEVAELLSISAETSRSQFSRARNWLKIYLINNKQKEQANGF